MSKSFSAEHLIRFSHCDPGGIVYFVHFFDMCNGTVEDWFAEVIGMNFNEIHLVRRWGFPIVDTGCHFYRPCRLSDRLKLTLAIAKLGRSSIEFSIRGTVKGDEKFRARHKVAMISLDTYRAIPIPDDLRAKMEPYVAAHA
ncbi:MAG TPA: thioesterase family protein [Burkholderiales bacterium]|nr:thioesterase family protein [Burkholderiales bacterium]